MDLHCATTYVDWLRPIVDVDSLLIAHPLSLFLFSRLFLYSSSECFVSHIVFLYPLVCQKQNERSKTVIMASIVEAATVMTMMQLLHAWSFWSHEITFSLFLALWSTWYTPCRNTPVPLRTIKHRLSSVQFFGAVIFAPSRSGFWLLPYSTNYLKQKWCKIDWKMASWGVVEKKNVSITKAPLTLQLFSFLHFKRED